METPNGDVTGSDFITTYVAPLKSALLKDINDASYVKDCSIKETMEKQAKLAKEYGIYGFVYYHYWFNGKKLFFTWYNNGISTYEMKNKKIFNVSSFSSVNKGTNALSSYIDKVILF